MIPLLAIIIFMMNFFSSLPGWKGGCGAAGKGVKPEKANMRLIAK